jgi:hypothetical protein
MVGTRAAMLSGRQRLSAYSCQNNFEVLKDLKTAFGRGGQSYTLL